MVLDRAQMPQYVFRRGLSGQIFLRKKKGSMIHPNVKKNKVSVYIMENMLKVFLGKTTLAGKKNPEIKS